jgi:RimJ/RimL family protein N-acetyltransferase
MIEPRKAEMEQQNSFGQPIGFPLPNWTKRSLPPRTPMIGRYCRLEPLDADRHGKQLYAAHGEEADESNWTYLSVDAPASFAEYYAWLKEVSSHEDPFFHAIVNAESGAALGVAAFMRIEPTIGVIEVGNINFSSRLKRTRAATEAIYLTMKRVFDELGYRRYEWKCDSLNAPSRAAADRYGFCFEGLFRQALVYKGRNRDTAWYSIIDREWPAIKAAFEHWLHPSNFDLAGIQHQRLSMLTRPIRRL